MAEDFGLRLGIEDEKAFKDAPWDINQRFKVLDSEMQLVTSQFDQNDSSVRALTARNEVLNREIDAQKDKVDTLRAALENAGFPFEFIKANETHVKASQLSVLRTAVN